METSLVRIEQAIDSGKVEQARALLRYELGESPSIDVLMLAVRVAIDDQQRKQFLERVIKLDPFHAEAHTQLRLVEKYEMRHASLLNAVPPSSSNSPLLAQQHNIQVHVNQAAPTVIIQNSRSRFVAFLLTLFLGPFGMFYSTAGGALIMIIVGILLLASAGGGMFPLIWIASIIWGVAAVK